MTPTGADLRRLTSNPDYDAQPDWAPGGRAIAFRARLAGATSFELWRMEADGGVPKRLTMSPPGHSSSQPAWFPDGRGILFRRTAGTVSSADVWRMGPAGQDPGALFEAPRGQWYPSWSPRMTRVLFATSMSVDETDRAISVARPDGTGAVTLFDWPGGFDSAPTWSPDGAQVAFESDGDPVGANPEHDREVFVMDSAGVRIRQLTRNAASHDEGPAWSPDGRLIAYTSGPDDRHGDIHVMTAAGMHLRRLTSYHGRDESPDWQAIPAPAADRSCGERARLTPGVRELRTSGVGCRAARVLARAWARAGNAAPPRRLGGFRSEVADFGGTQRVVLSRPPGSAGAAGRVVAFLHEP